MADETSEQTPARKSTRMQLSGERTTTLEEGGRVVVHGSGFPASEHFNAGIRRSDGSEQGQDVVIGDDGTFSVYARVFDDAKVTAYARTPHGDPAVDSVDF